MPSNQVGSVSVKVRLDQRDALRELESLRKKLSSLEQTLSEKRARRDSLSEEIKQADLAADLARQRVEQLKAALATASPQARAGIRAELNDANAELRAATSEAAKLDKEQIKLNSDIATGEEQAAKLGEQIENVERQLEATNSFRTRLLVGSEKAVAALQKRFHRLAMTIRRVFTLTIIRSGLQAFGALRDYITDVLKSTPAFSAALGEAKGALLTMAQPILDKVIPALTQLMHILAQVAMFLAHIIAVIFGTTAEKSAEGAAALYDQAKAYKATGSAAKKAANQVAAFDQLNILSDNSSSGGGGSPGGAITPTFDTDLDGIIAERLRAIELLVGEALLALGAVLTFTGVNIPLGLALMAIGAASAYAAFQGDWSELKAQLEGPIGTIMTILSGALLVLGGILAFSGANIPLGIALMAIGAAGLATLAALNWEELKAKMTGALGEIVAIVSAALLALGAVLAFSGAAIPLGIALMVLGAAGLAADAALNWDKVKKFISDNLDEIVATLGAALLCIGAVLAFSGANIPLGIALMAAGAVALANAVALNWDEIKEKLKGKVGEIVAIVSGALLVIGIILVCTGVALPLGIGLLAAGAAGLATEAALNWDMIVDKLRGTVGRIVTIVSGSLLVIGILLACTGVALPLGIGLIVAGAAGLAAETAINWDYLLNMIKGVWDAIVRWFAEKVAPKLTKEYWQNKFKSISDGLKDKIKDGINAAIGLLNKFIDWVNDKLNITWKSLEIGGVEIVKAGGFQLLKLPNIPYLAQGAVIPPNREFMAVLGDQKHGTNIEAPLDTMVQAFNAANGGTVDAIYQIGNLIIAAIQNQELAAYLDGKKVSQQLYSPMQAVARTRGSALVKG